MEVVYCRIVKDGYPAESLERKNVWLYAQCYCILKAHLAINAVKVTM